MGSGEDDSEESTGRWSQRTATVLQPGQDGMVRGRKRLCLTIEISAYLSHILEQSRTRRYISPRTENHGVHGSNPGPATYELPANREELKGTGGAAGALCQQSVKGRPLLGRSPSYFVVGGAKPTTGLMRPSASASSLSCIALYKSSAI